MSLRDPDFPRDKHLQIALQHAPDSDIAPSASTQKAVLDYADNALKLGQKSHVESWFTRIIKAFSAWQLPRWQLAGMGSLAASLLVVVMIWHENPDDPLQVASAPEVVQSKAMPSVQAELTQNEPARDELNQAEQSAQAVAESAPTDNTAPVDNTALATSPEAASGQVLEKDADSTSAKEAVVMAEVAPPAPVAAAPAIASVEARTAAPATVQSAPVKMKKMAEAEQAEAKADSPSAIAAAKPAALASNSDLAMTLGKLGGQTLAIADIKLGKLRILYLSNVENTVDEATGYRKEAVLLNEGAKEGASEATSLKALAQEVEAYNQTMREWHLKSLAK